MLMIATVLLCSGLILPAQGPRTQELGIGKLLVAKKDTRDPAFAESVILLVRYDHDGTVGLMINRPTNVPVSRALQSLKGSKERSDPVYAGGPVGELSVLGLMRANKMPEDANHVTGKLYFVSTRVLLEKTLARRADPKDFRIYLGYCGWGTGQLENELRLGLWHVFPATENLVFDSEPDSLWMRLIARTEMSIAQSLPPIHVSLFPSR